MRTLIATVLYNAKRKQIYCRANKVSEQNINSLKAIDRILLEENGFTFINMLSLDHPNVKGYVIFFEGHLDQMNKILKSLEHI